MGRKLNGLEKSRIGSTAAEVTVHRGADLLFTRFGGLREQLRRFDYQAIQAIATLRGLLFDNGLLQRM
jgi:hypothetical protein